MIRTQKRSPSPTQINRTPPKQKSSPPKTSNKKLPMGQSQKQNLFQLDFTKTAQGSQQINSQRSARKLGDANGRQFISSEYSKLNQNLRVTIDRIEEQDNTSNERSKSKSIKSQRRVYNQNNKIPSLGLNKTTIGPDTPIFSRALPKYPEKSSTSRAYLMQQPLKSDRKHTQNQQKSAYNYTHNMSIQMTESNIGGLANRREKQAEYNIKRHHIETMHRQIGDLLKVVNKRKDQPVRNVEQYEDKQGQPQSHRGFEYTLKFDALKGKEEEWRQQMTNRRETERINQHKDNQYLKIEESAIICTLPINKEVSPCLPISISNINSHDKEIFDDFVNQYKIFKAQQNQQKFHPSEDQVQKNVEPQKTKYNYTDEKIACQDVQEKQTGRQTNRREKLTYRQANSSRGKEKEETRDIMRQKLKQEWADMEEMNSEYVDVIDKEISKIKERIIDSERVTKQMENKYLGQGLNDRSSSPLLQQSEQPMGFTLIQQSHSQQINHAPQETQGNRYSYVKQFTIPQRTHRKDNQVMFDSIRTRLASNLARQVEIDMGMRKWREHMMEAIKQRGMTNLWGELCKKLSTLGYNCSEEELAQLLSINSCESNPFVESTVSGAGPAIKNIIQTLASLFMESQQFWYNNVIGTIDRQEAYSCGFSMGVLDLNKKGFICVEDIVCFVNLYAGKFYRNRDFMMVSRRIVKEERAKAGKEKSIEYEDMENILFDNVRK